MNEAQREDFSCCVKWEKYIQVQVSSRQLDIHTWSSKKFWVRRINFGVIINI